jgi:hypothetical protein
MSCRMWSSLGAWQAKHVPATAELGDNILPANVRENFPSGKRRLSEDSDV